MKKNQGLSSQGRMISCRGSCYQFSVFSRDFAPHLYLRLTTLLKRNALPVAPVNRVEMSSLRFVRKVSHCAHENSRFHRCAPGRSDPSCPPSESDRSPVRGLLGSYAKVFGIFSNVRPFCVVFMQVFCNFCVSCICILAAILLGAIWRMK